MSAANRLDEIVAQGVKKKGRGCRQPGCDAPTRAVVSVAIRRFADGAHTAGNYDGSVTRQWSFCEKHAVEAWEAVMEAEPGD